MNAQRFLDRLSAFHQLSSDCRDSIYAIIQEEIYTRNEVIVSPGQISSKLWFIEKGFAMQYTYKDFDKRPYRFWQEGELVVNIAGFFGRIPSEIYIEILETSTLLAIKYEQMQSLFGMFPEIQRLAFLIVEDYQESAEKRAMDLLTLSAEQRYMQLLEDIPFVEQKVPIDNIATYLGISRKTLGRIRIRKNSRQQC